MPTIDDPSYLEWTRFWAPLGEAIQFDSDGFVLGPTTDRFIQPNEHFREFSGFNASPLLLLVGEPGLGKSREIEIAANTLSRRLADERDDVLFVDMKQTAEESRLRELIFESEAFAAWSEGDHVLHLFLDSLDEARQGVHRIKSLILHGLDGADIERLRLRIACRTAERIEGLELQLARLFQIEAPDVIELMPLTKDEISFAIEHAGLDRDTFFNALVEKELQPFANSPNFLFKLILEFKERGQFPGSTVELFEHFCAKACEEPNEEETSRPHVSSAALVDISSRIATAMTFSGHSSVVTGREPRPNECGLTDLLTAEERLGNPPTVLTEAEALVDRAIQTSIFTGYTAHSVGFKSKTIAEFLTARHLIRSNLRMEDLVRLTTAEFDGRIWVQPQMVEVAKWLAQMDAGYREFAVANIPTALVGGNAQYLTDEQRQAVLRALFESIETQEIGIEQRSFRRGLAQLDNASAPDLVMEKLNDRNLTDEARGMAIDAIRSMSLTAILPQVTSIAIDESESIRLRTDALYAIGDLGDHDSREAVAVLGLEPPEGDSDDEVKGAALRAAFPAAISAEDLYSHLTRPKRDALIGAYSGFLYSNIIQNLEDDDLHYAMTWLESSDANEDPLGPLGTLQQKLFIRFTELPPEHELWPRIAAYAAERVSEYHDLIERPTFRGDSALSEDGRKTLVSHLVPLIDDEELSWSKISMATPPLVTYEDAEWVLGELEKSIGSDLEYGWADIAWAATHLSVNPEQFAKACDLSDRFYDRAVPSLAVDVNSDFAEELRERHGDAHGEEERREGDGTEAIGPNLSPEFIEGFEELLSLAESGDLDGFWQLAAFRDASSRRITDNHDESARLVQLLEALPESLTPRACTVAVDYLERFEPNAQDWMGKPVMHWPSVAAYRAMRLLDAQARDWLDANVSILIRWVHTIVWWPFHSGDEAEFHGRLANKLISESADTLVDALVEFVRAQAENHRLVFIPMDGTLRQLDIGPFESPLLDFLPELEAKPDEWRAFLKFMISNGSDLAVGVANEAVRGAVGAEAEDPKRARGIDSAAMLVALDFRANWSTLAESFHADSALGKAVVERVSDDRESSVWSGLSSAELGATYEWLEQEFPLFDDPPIEEAESSRHRIGRLRNNALMSLSRQGTRSAVTEIARLREALPHLDFLPRVRHTAIVECLRAERKPVTPQEAIELCRAPELRAITSETDLRQVVLESLSRYQVELETTGECLDFWNENPQIKPKPEGIVSDKLKRWFERDLRDRGILINREVIVQTLPHGQDGDRTDLKIEVSFGDQTFCVIVEVKGCWNRDVPGALESQLVDQYLVPMGLDHGIYLIAKFDLAKWDESDDRRNAPYSRKAIEDIRSELDQLAAEVSARRALQVDAVVLRIPMS